MQFQTTFSNFPYQFLNVILLVLIPLWLVLANQFIDSFWMFVHVWAIVKGTRQTQ